VIGNGSVNVGIGTTAPGYPLTVLGTAVNTVVVNTPGGLGGPAMSLIASSAGTGRMLMSIQSTGAYTYLGSEASGGGTFTNSLAYASIFGSNTNTATQLIAYGAVGLTLLSGGNVGIGTTAPLMTLDVYGTAGAASLSTYSGGVASFRSVTGPILEIGAESGSPYGFWLQAKRISDTSAWPISLNPLGGNVGIGTTAPTSPLQVVTLPTYTSNATAAAGGLTAGAFFKVSVAGEYFVHVVV
jgi:hypothetical protein